jgi:hypothetical protein
MEINQIKKDEIVRDAECLLFKTNLLIAQCGSWLPEEEGVKIAMERILNREKAERKARYLAAINRVSILTDKAIFAIERIFGKKNQ